MVREGATGAGLALLWAAAVAVPAQASWPSTPDEAGRMQVAAKGTEAAAKGGIGREELKRRLKSALRSAGGHSGTYVVDADASRNARLYASPATGPWPSRSSTTT